MTYLEAAEFLKSHDNYLILTHKRPDGDAIGCSAALCDALRVLGKTAHMAASLDATVMFTEYLEGRVAPEGFVPHTVVSVDTASRGMLPPNTAHYADRIDLAIDHHGSNEFYAKETCLEADKAACGEIIWKICDYLGGMTPAIASLLYVAVSTDCGCFVYSNVTAHTHRVAAALMDAGADYRRLNKKHFRTKTMGRMMLESLMLRDMKLHFGNTVAVVPISLAMMEEAKATNDDTEDIAAVIGQIAGLHHSATLRELKPGECKISLRTNSDLLDASAVCARLGGGGHKAAAGCTVYGTMAEGEEAIVNAIAAQMAEMSRR